MSTPSNDAPRSDVSVGTWIRYLFGHAESIRALARSAGAWQVSLALVLLTSIARNYDQTWIGEKPFHWIAGNILFSTVSGSALFVWVRIFMTNRIDDPNVPFGASWRQFMGLFWGTAPVAWLYAIPVERWAGSMEAAHFNLTLLAVVSLWRVLLMARIIGVLHSAAFWRALCWVLSMACVEVVVVMLGSGTLSRQIMAGMGGLRNSPEEDVLARALSTTAGVAFYGFIPMLILGLVARMLGNPRFTANLVPGAGRLPWIGVAVAAALWIGVAIPAQQQTRSNAEIDALAANGEWRQVINHLIAHEPQAYAASRQLPPKVYEYEVYEGLPGLLGAIRTNDPVRIHQLAVSKWTQFCFHLEYEPSLSTPHPALGPARLRWGVHHRIAHLDETYWLRILDGLEASQEGRAWLTNNRAVFDIVMEAMQDQSDSKPRDTNQPPVLSPLEERIARYPAPPKAGSE